MSQGLLMKSAATTKSIQRIFNKQRDFFNSNHTKDVGFRVEQLKKLYRAIQKHEDPLYDALWKDLHKSKIEAYGSEIGLSLHETSFALKHIHSWTRSEKIGGQLLFPLSKARVESEPYGVTLTISPYNYPFSVCILPLIGSIAAGNCSILKPSEFSAHTTNLISTIVEETFDEEYIAVVQGDRTVTQSLLSLPLNYIFFIGSTAVGKLVMEAAAKNVIPLTLELSGKNHTIVDRDITLNTVAKRIIWSKFLNMGQSCTTIDVLHVHKDVKNKLLDKLKQYIVTFHGNNQEESKHYGRLINKKHFDRLSGYLNEGTVVCGGTIKEKELYISPTIIDQIPEDAAILHEEIFGPILPIVEYENLDELLLNIHLKPTPLAISIFSNDTRIQDKVINGTTSGSIIVNNSLSQGTSPKIPHGGVGASGFGRVHGKYTFDAFSYKRSIVQHQTLFDLPGQFPPYNNMALTMLRKLFK